MPQFGHNAGAQAQGQDLLPGHCSLHPHILSFLFPWQTTAYPLLSPWGEGVLPIYNGGHGEASPKRGTFFGLNVYEREGISLCQWVIICQ